MKLSPPKTYGGRTNVWDPDEEAQRARWNKDRQVWDPDTASWRDPRLTDFEEIPEEPTPVEDQIPEDRVPATCLGRYTTYTRQQAEARELQRQIEGTKTRYLVATKRFRTNILRANAQMGIDVGLAIGGITSSAFDAARAGFRPTPGTGSGMPPLMAMGEEARNRLRQRGVDLNNELSAARSRLARSQLEAEVSGLNPTSLRAAVDEAAAEVSSLRRRISDIVDPPHLVSQAARLRAEISAAKAELGALDREGVPGTMWDAGQGGIIRSAMSEVDDELAAAAEGKILNPSWDEKAFQEHRFEARQARKTGQIDDAEYGRLLGELERDKFVDAGPGKTMPLARHQELMNKRAELEANYKDGFEKVQTMFGSDDAFRKRSIDMTGGSVDPRAVALREEVRGLEGQEDQLGRQLEDARDANRILRREAEGDLGNAELRHEEALAERRKLEAVELRARKDAGAVQEIERQAAAVAADLAQVEEGLAGLAQGRPPSALPAVVLGVMLAALSPVAAATAVAGVVAFKVYDLMGIGPQSPQEIMRILLEDKQEMLKMEQNLKTLEDRYDKLLVDMPAAMKELRECIEANTPKVAP